MAERKAFQDLPQWQGVFEDWSRKWVNKNYWRVSHRHGSHEDSLQECALVFARCLKYYRGTKVNNHKWFMALYKTAVSNAWNGFSVKDSQDRETLVPGIDQEAEEFFQLNAQATDMSSTNWGPLAAHLKYVAGDLVEVLTSIATLPTSTIGALFGGDSPDAVRSQIKRHAARPAHGTTFGFGQPMDDDFMVEVIRHFVELRLSGGEARKTALELVEEMRGLLAV